MNELEALMAKMDEAKAKATAAPDDKKLQVAAADAEKAYNEAKAAAAAGTGDPDPDDEFDESHIKDEKTKKYIEKLRKEAAGHRTKAKDLKSKLDLSEDQKKKILVAAGISEEPNPEEKLKLVSSANQNLEFRAAILESALKSGIPPDQVDYYQFLVTKATNELGEGEELEDDKLEAIVKEVKKLSQRKSASSTVDDGKGNKTPNPNDSGTITLEKFCGMSMIEKGKLFTSNENLYRDLMKQAKSKKMLV